MSLISAISAKSDSTLSEFGEYAPYLAHKTPTECVDAMYKADVNTKSKRDKRGHTLFHFFQKLISKNDLQSNPNKRVFANHAHQKLNTHTISKAISTQLQGANQHYQGLTHSAAPQAPIAAPIAPVAVPQAAHKSREELIAEAEARLDKKPTDPQARYDLACLYMDNKCHIPAMSLLTVAAKQLEKSPSATLSLSDLQQRIKKCSEKVAKQAKAISKVAKKIKFGGDITKIAKSKIAKGLTSKIKKHDTLLPVEAALIRLFTSTQEYYLVLNAYLRGDKAQVDKWMKNEKVQKHITLSFLKETTPIMKHCLAKMPSLQNLYPENSENRTVFRGMATTAEHIAKLQREMKFVNSGFASSSRSMGTALGFTATDPAKKERILFITEGRTGVPIHNLSHFESEKEVLFAPKTAFKISSIKKVTPNDEFAKKIPNFKFMFPNLWVVKMKEQTGTA